MLRSTPLLASPHLSRANAQHGASLIVVMLIMIVVSILGVGGAQIALMAERGARNDRDMQLAWQSAEAALIDAEIDLTTPTAPITVPPSLSKARGDIFGMTTVGTGGMKRNVQTSALPIDNGLFPLECGLANTRNAGLCGLPVVGSTDKPAWLAVDFTEEDVTKARSTAFGEFTGRTFEAGSIGVQPAQVPRYTIELIPDPGRDKTKPADNYVYRVTAMGFGPREDIQAVLQMLYRN